mmetsp:Transcript_66648/g.118470  ORF Transcript_66648/g.118470 Transcript_66648/m.118470 type:complete len:114 (-) Transcript_66648:5-346(-)
MASTMYCRWCAEAAEDLLATVTVSNVAVCAGSGGSVLSGVSADLYLTGEMSHHEIIAANHAGTNVILTDHSNTERGYLPEMAEMLATGLTAEVGAETFKIKVTQLDSDPLLVV